MSFDPAHAVEGVGLERELGLDPAQLDIRRARD
jgi:hypothetical protein